MQTFESDAVATRRPRQAERRQAESQAAVGWALASGHHESLQPSGILHLQRTAGNASVAGMLGEESERSPVLDVVESGGGQPLEQGVRSGMEASFGHDFGDVRVHTDGRATDSAKAVQAHAYTVGSNIVFQGDRYSPGTSEGQRMLAHELTHVVQQRSGPVDGTEAAGGIKVSDPSDRFEREAEATADHVMSGGGPASANAAGGQAASPVQREEAPEEEVQTLAVQREEAPEEEVQTLAVQREEAPEEETEG